MLNCVRWLFRFSPSLRETQIMLRIYDSKDQIPEAILEHYNKRSDGKWEPQVEGVNSIGGLITKRDELLNKVAEIPTLKIKIAEFEGMETLPAGKVAVDKTAYTALQAEHEAYAALGKLEEIKPKVEGYEDLQAKDLKRTKDEQYRAAAKAAGYDETKFIKLASDDGIETVVKTVTENGKSVEKVFVKTVIDGKETETAITDYVTASPNFAPFADSLTANDVTPTGTKVIRQGLSGAATPTLEAEKEAARSTGAYSI